MGRGSPSAHSQNPFPGWTIPRGTGNLARPIMWKELRWKKLRARPLPSEWQRIVATQCVFYSRLPVADRAELAGHMQVLLAEKKFEGCGGLLITEEMRVVIAAHACLLLLHRSTDYYPQLRTILVYPGSYVVPVTRHVGGGIWEEGWQSRSGESWQTGATVLAWEEVSREARESSPENVVLHEFAHQLDYEDGGMADGIPALAQGESFALRQQRYAAWTRLMRAEYEQLRRGWRRASRRFCARMGPRIRRNSSLWPRNRFLGIPPKCSGRIRRGGEMVDHGWTWINTDLEKGGRQLTTEDSEDTEKGGNFGQNVTEGTEMRWFIHGGSEWLTMDGRV